MMYCIEREQQLYCSLETAWKFFSTPYNLAKITPRELKFEVLTNLEGVELAEGLIIDYTIRPLLGIPVHWQTKITHVNHLRSFTDFQLQGPYALWNHYHEFTENKHGVLMFDKVDYELPLGWLGKLTHSLVVEKKLNHIFAYRREVLETIFAKPRHI